MSSCPLAYLLCSQTVTVYRQEAQFIHRKVEENCFFCWQEQQSADTLGRHHDKKFLLILPGENRQIRPGDRVFCGVGPAVTPEAWNRFLPVSVPELAEVAYVEPCFWNGTICHTEAGRK